MATSKHKQPRDRIKAIRVVNASELIENPENWREHPDAQSREMARILDTVGNVDVLKVVERPDGSYLLIDGHLRKRIAGNARVKIAVLDLDENETRIVLESFDRIGAMAETNEAALARLLQQIENPVEIPADPAAIDLGAERLLSEQPWTPEDRSRADDIATRVSNHLRRIADEAPHLLTGAEVIVLPVDGSCEALIIADPDLHDVATELRARHEQGEKRPLDRLFAALWTPPSNA